MTKVAQRKVVRCAIYTRKSSEEGLEQQFNSLHAQREACEAYVHSQRGEGWTVLPTHYDDGGFSGGTLERPGIKQLMDDIRARKVDTVIVYKVDRLSRSLVDFVRMIELFDQHGVSFVSVTQQFNTSSSMGRLTLNVLLSFAQFEREVTGERIRDKIAASKRKGLWMGGVIALGYDVKDKALVINKREAETVRRIFASYLKLGCVRRLKAALDAAGIVSKARGGAPGKQLSRGALYTLLRNPLYIGKVRNRGTLHDGQHPAIVTLDNWRRVQKRLADNALKARSKSECQNPSLLAGLLVDDRGNAMSPAHTRKGARRYRYYVSQAVLQYRDRDAGSVTRVPSQTVEEVVRTQLCQLLTTPKDLIGVLGARACSGKQQKDVIRRAKALSDQWSQLNTSEHISHLRQCVKQITIGREQIQIAFSRRGLREMIGVESTDSDLSRIDEENIHAVSVPVELRRCGIETKLIVTDGALPSAHAESVTALQSAVRRAFQWNEALQNGQFPSMRALAKQEGMTQRYLSRRMKLLFLAPEIIEAIIQGNIPIALSLEKLRHGFPLDWSEQRQIFGFAR